MILCKTGVRYLLPQQELVNCLLLPHALDYQPVQVDKQSSPKTTRNPTHTHTETRLVWPVEGKTEQHCGAKQKQPHGKRITANETKLQFCYAWLSQSQLEALFKEANRC